jgi:flagellar protein FlaG
MSSEISNKVAAEISGTTQGSGVISSATRGSFSSQDSRISQTQRAAAASSSQSQSASEEPADKAAEVSSEELMQAVEEMNEYFQNVQRNIHFSVDDDTGTTVVKVIESDTEEVIRQIPSEEILALSKYIEESAGRIIRAEA